MEIWHKRIKELRENTGITLKDMAKIIGVSEATVQRYESGKIQELPYKVITAYAKKFGVTPSYIMGWIDTPTEDVLNFNPNYHTDYIIDQDYILFERTDSHGSEKRIYGYARGISNLIKYIALLNDDGIEELTKHTKLLLNSDDYRREIGEEG